MKAWRVHEVGDFHDVLVWEDCDTPAVQPNSALVKVEAAAVNFPDILFIAGQYQMRPPLPFVPGLEAVGEVVEVGEGSEMSVGDRVIVTGIGAFAEYILALDAMSFPAPEGMPAADAAAFRVVYQTAHMALVRRARLQAGETLVVHGGSGGAGTAAIQVGKALGARVIATAHTPEHLQVCKDVGADDVLDYRDDDLVAGVKNLTGGRGADVFFDPVGDGAFEASTHSVNFEGRIVVIGFASGHIPEIRANMILNKNIDVLGMYWTNYELLYPDIVDEVQEDLNAMYARGEIRPVISHVMPLSELPEALDAMQTHHNHGKIILEP